MRFDQIPRFVTLPVAFAMVLGAVGFVCGYVGPIVLDPSASLGPLLGIYFTGPVASVLGFVLGLAVAGLRLHARGILAILLVAIPLTALGALYLSLPEDRYVGSLIDAEVRGCEPPSTLISESVHRWEVWNAETPWRTPRAGWKEDLPHMMKTDRGVVLTMFVHRKREIYEQRRPWNLGRLRATPWRSAEGPEKYFTRDSNGSCTNHSVGDRELYCPVWEASTVSPPDILPTFLGLFVLDNVPSTFRPFATDGAGG